MKGYMTMAVTGSAICIKQTMNIWNLGNGVGFSQAE
jgi:hypothetical protein